MLSCSQNKTGLFSKPRSRGLGEGEALKPTALSIEKSYLPLEKIRALLDKLADNK